MRTGTRLFLASVALVTICWALAEALFHLVKGDGVFWLAAVGFAGLAAVGITVQFLMLLQERRDEREFRSGETD